jgi:phenylpyruvate tautomerase PptA (4-oxalocrotonate tautomerase family)
MPIVDVELVCSSEAEFRAVSAAAVAQAAGEALGSPVGRTWVRLRYLGNSCYAENGCALSEVELPVFVTILHAQPPVGAALSAELSAITQAIAKALARPVERVHIQYAPAGAGRQAFGGHLVQ